MVRLRAKRLPPGSIKKMHAKSAGPYTIICKISDNPYIVDLPKNLGISAIFNVEDISLYHLPTEQMEDITMPHDHTISFPLDHTVECIIDDQIILHPDKEERYYLVKWVNQPNTEDA